MATMRKLNDADVRAIFECLHHNKEPPENLKFQIVAVGSSGQKLSPPSFQFEDGLYVLLKPQRKKDKIPDYSKVPIHLRGYIMHKTPPEGCPWQLSGPQFPLPTAIQQRYCYPKNKEEFAHKRGGALWTMYDANGKEDIEFRLLHVYYSCKRAQNNGYDVPSNLSTNGNGGAVSSDESYSPSPPAKRAKRANNKNGRGTSTRGRPPKTRNSSQNRNLRTPRATRGAGSSNHHPHPGMVLLPTTSPAITASPATSIDTLPPPNPNFNSPPTYLRATATTGPNNSRGRPRRCQKILVDKSSPLPSSPVMPPLNNNHTTTSLIPFDCVEDYCDDDDTNDVFNTQRIHPVGSHEMGTSPYGDIFATTTGAGGPAVPSSHYHHYYSHHPTPPFGGHHHHYYSVMSPYNSAATMMPPLVQQQVKESAAPALLAKENQQQLHKKKTTATTPNNSKSTVYPHQQLNHNNAMLMHKTDQDLHSLYLNDPLVSIPTQPSMDYLLLGVSNPDGEDSTAPTTTTRTTYQTPTPDSNVAIEHFTNHLDTLHKRLREMINTAPSSDKAIMVSTLTSWAQHVAIEPLGGGGGGGELSSSAEDTSAATMTTTSKTPPGPAAVTTTTTTTAASNTISEQQEEETEDTKVVADPKKKDD